MPLASSRCGPKLPKRNSRPRGLPGLLGFAGRWSALTVGSVSVADGTVSDVLLPPSRLKVCSGGARKSVQAMLPPCEGWSPSGGVIPSWSPMWTAGHAFFAPLAAIGAPPNQGTSSSPAAGAVVAQPPGLRPSKA
jgi:hypothetical protein